MAERILAQIYGSLEHLVQRAEVVLFGGSSAGNAPVNGIRWEGMSNAQLAEAVQQLADGPGASAMTTAADALNLIGQQLATIDQTLHDQLQAIGVNWTSTAAELAQEMTTASAAYGAGASQAGGQNSTSVNQAGDAYAAAKNAVPSPSTLNGPPQPNLLDAVGQILTGHGNDHAKQVKQSNQARQQAIDTMNNYTNNTQTSLDGAHPPMPPAPAINLQSGSVDGNIGVGTTASSYPGVAGGLPLTNPSYPGVGPAPTYLPGPSSTAAVPPVVGAGPGLPQVGGLPGGTGGLPGLTPNLPGVGGVGPLSPGSPTPLSPLSPGPVSGVGAPNFPTPGLGNAAQSAASAGASSAFVEDAAVGAAIVGGTAGAGVAGASAERDRLVRSRDLAGDVEGEEQWGARAQASRVIAELEGEEAEAAQAAERIGVTAEPPPSMLEPAVSGRRRDDEHRNRYLAESEDMFGDDRMVVPPVLGSAGDADDQR